MTYLKNLFFMLMLISVSASAQNSLQLPTTSKIAGAESVRMSESRNTIEFVKLKEQTSISEADHLRWLKNSVLQSAPDEGFDLIRSESDQLGFTHYRYQQTIQNIPVEHGVYYVHCKNGKVESANGEAYPKSSNATSASISLDQAFAKALDAIPSTKYNSENGGVAKMKQEGTLVWYNNKEQGLVLAYKFDIYSLEPLNRAYVFIDATTGKKVGEESKIHFTDVTGTTTTAYNGTTTFTTDFVSANSYRLRASKGFGGLATKNLNNGSSYGTATDFTDTDNNWNVTTIDKYAYDAHYGSEATYDYYYAKFGRNSYDNAGAAINAYVHYGSNYVNAFWDGTQMTYGDGDGSSYFPLTSLDIVAHEISHAVTEHTAALVYSNESGALNEAYSDCFGVTVDFYKHPSAANFLMGDQISSTATPFRNMGNPNQFSNPDCYGGLYWNAPNEVHNNSGVMNYWYYLICMGGNGTNDLSNNFYVDSIGIDKAGSIIYRTLSVYLSANSTYADMRTYSIQAATDLYGSCSNEVQQVANAWYAVGVGGLFSNFVTAGFSATNTNICALPASVIFTNQSLNSTTYLWDFGDGSTSTLLSPTHTYSTIGTYTVTLIAYGNSLCTGSDTLVRSNYINILPSSGILPASCFPLQSGNHCCGYGISKVTLGTINNTSGDATEGNKDFTCGITTTLIAGDQVPITIKTSGTTNENVKAWIDYNNNGILDSITERVFVSNNKLQNHNNYIHNSSNAVLNTPLRLRVSDDYVTNSISSPCSNLYYGQSEDYEVRFIESTQAPTADFIVDNGSITTGASASFTDLSINGATSWTWSFPGGAPSTSTQRNPVIAYNAIGVYPVSLTVANSFGSGSITKLAYINVMSVFIMCTSTSSALTSGIIYDSGGPTGVYQDNENCHFAISAGCADTLSITIDTFQVESNYDFLRIYDGSNATAPLLASLTGTVFPITYYATSGNLYLAWTSDVSVTYSGFKAHWSSIVNSPIPVVAGFTSLTNPPLNVPVSFIDTSTNSPNTWLWNFGDGATSTLQNPTHIYASSGAFAVTLIAYNCSSSDTVINYITVQQSPIISVQPDTIFQTVSCGDSIVVPIVVYNQGNGDLEYSAETDPIRVLAFMGGVDSLEEWIHTRDIILQGNPKAKITKFYGANATALSSAMQSNDVLLFPEHEASVNINYTALASAVNSIASNGKTIIVCGSTSPYGWNRIFDMGLFTGSYSGYYYSTLYRVNSTDEIIAQVAPAFPYSNVTNLNTITNSDLIPLVNDSSGKRNSFYRNIGLGRAIHLGFDYYIPSSNSAQLLINSVNSSKNIFAGLSVDSSSTIPVAPGDSSIIYVTINSTNVNAGLWESAIEVYSNDTANRVLTIPVYINVVGGPKLSLTNTCINFDTVYTSEPTIDSIMIWNIGCDTLKVTDVQLSNSKFSSTVTNFNIKPFSYYYLKIILDNSISGVFSGNVTLINNDQDTSICLTAVVLDRPEIVITPNPLEFNLAFCEDSLVLPFYVHNNGAENLIFSIDTVVIDTTRILTYYAGSDLSTNGEYNNTLAALHQYYTKYTVDSTNTGDATVLQSKLIGKNILMFIEQENATSINYATLQPVVNSFIQNGGTVIVCSDYSGQSRVLQLGLFTGSIANAISSGSLNIVGSNDSLASNVIPPFNAVSQTTPIAITNTDVVNVITHATGSVVAYRNIGLGKAIFVGFDYGLYNSNSAQVLANAVRLNRMYDINAAISLSDTTGVIAPQDSQLVYATFHKGEMEGGNYSALLYFTTNDPLLPTYAYPVNIQIPNYSKAKFSAIADICSGVAIFNNTTIGVTSYLWDFGDGTISTLQNPMHAYSDTGTYTVTLIAYGSLFCGGSDTLIIPNYLIINSISGLLPASCFPVQSGSTCCGLGISNVTIGTINNTSGDAMEGNKDFTCGLLATLIAGDPIPISITTGISYGENVKVWIDFNNNGILDSIAELVFVSNNKLLNHTGYLLNTINAVLNTPLRLRVIDEYEAITINGPCINLTYGQSEDYSVKFIADTLPPIANFTVVDSIVSVGSSVIFTDLSSHVATSWSWSFPGATPSTSTLKNPQVTYNSVGVYPVFLTVTNSFGTDSITKLAYIRVANGFNMCNFSNSSLVTGIIYDSGGQLGNYSNNESCSFTISSLCVSPVSFTIDNFSSEVPDRLMIYNGVNSSAPLLANLSGTVQPTTYVASSGKIYLAWTSNNAATSSGFKAHWVYNLLTIPGVEANFSASSFNPLYGDTVVFTDSTTNQPIYWQWNFGDGAISTAQNPKHLYSSSGIYTVTLISRNCNTSLSDTISKIIIVQGPPIISVSPSSINQTISCGDSLSVNFTIKNQGTGNLFVTPSFIDNDTIKILSFMDGVDSLQEYVTTINTITYGYPKVKITKFYGYNPSALLVAMLSQDVLLFPENEFSTGINYASLASVVNTIASNGKSIIICGSGTGYANRIFDMGLFTGSYVSTLSGSLHTITANAGNPILNQVSPTFNTSNGTFANQITNSDLIPLVNDISNRNVVFARNIGTGRVIYLGFDYFTTNSNTAKLLANAVSSSVAHGGAFSFIYNSAELAPGDSTVLTLNYNATNAGAGLHMLKLFLQSNDPNSPTINIPIYLNILSVPRLVLDKACLNFDTIYKTVPTSDTILITNIGCNSLLVSNVQFSNTNFSSATTSFNVLPNDNYKLIVNANTATNGVFTGSVTLFNNDHDTTLCLNAVVLDRPQISISPNPLVFNAGFCDDSLVVPFYIYNREMGVLNYWVKDYHRDTTHILAYYAGADLSANGEYKNTFNALNQYYTKYTVDSTNTVDSTILKGRLVDKDVLIFIEQENTTNINYLALKPVITTFIQTGGTVIFCSDYSQFHRAITLGLFTGNYSAPISNVVLLNVLPNDLLGNNIGSSFLAPAVTSPMLITNPDLINVINNVTGSAAAYRNIGYGTAIYLGFDYATLNNNSSRILANAVHMCGVSGTSGLIDLSSIYGTIAPFDSQLVYATVHVGNLGAGNYSNIIRYNSNDPYNHALILNVNIHVSDQPCAAFTFITDSCTGEVNFINATSANASNYFWSFGDGSTSSSVTPTHIYNTPGNYTVTLLASNSFGTDTLMQTITVNFFNSTISLSGILASGQTIQFNNTTTGIMSCFWDFGDGTTSTQNPVNHTYSAVGNYLLTNVSSNGNCTDTTIQMLVIGTVGVETQDPLSSFNIFPNPFSESLMINYSIASKHKVSLKVLDVTGRVIRSLCNDETQSAGTHQYVFENNAAGVYFVELSVDGKKKILRTVKL